jgi:glucose-6-phosphate isomerase
MSLLWSPDCEQGEEDLLQTFSKIFQQSPGFMADLPEDSDLDHIEAVAATIPSDHEILLLGIGGSSLGTLALVDALCPPQASRLTVLDNIDPDTLARTLETLDLEQTTVLVISKSGGTAETTSQLLWILDAFSQAGLPAENHVVAITDPKKGCLRELVDRCNWRSLPVPPAVGGRYSVLTAVGLLPASLCGIDIRTLIHGAKTALASLKSATVDHGLVRWLSGWRQQHDQCPNVVHFAYRDRLVTLGDWFAQLWAESLGKRLDLDGNEVFRGSTPLVARGVTDQHSLVQLFVEGPADKQFLILDARLPSTIGTISEASAGLHEDLQYLAGKSLEELRLAELEGTVAALQSAGRPVSVIQFEDLDEAHLGAWILLMMVATVVAADHLTVDPFDQPGVEGGKAVAFARMGKPGWQSRGEAIEAGARALKPAPAIEVR